MDPISALLLSLALASLAVNTGSAAVGDAVAKARGRTPPSEHKWNARQVARRQRGESAERDPGPWRRRWANSVEARTEKAAQKHQARMEALRDNADHVKAKHKQRLHKRAQRREQVAATVARWGHTSWDATKGATRQAAVKAREARAERQAWRENTRRGTDTTEDTEGPPVGAADAENVVPIHPTEDSRDSAADDDEHQEDTGQVEPDTSNEGQEDAIPVASEESTPETTPNSEGTPVTMNAPAHSGEITDLPTAIAYCQATVQYCDQITGTFETSQAQASAAVTDLGQQLATLETAQSTLAGQGMGGEIQTRMTAMAEQFASLVQQLQQAEQLLAATQEAIGSARADADTAGEALQAQMGIAEEIQTHQANGVADNTAFYANA